MINSPLYAHAWPEWRMRYLLRKNPTNEQKERLSIAEQLSFVPMEAIGENGGINLSIVREKEEVDKGYTLFFDGDILIAKITPCFENFKGAIAAGLYGGVAYGTTELHVLRPKPNLDGRFLFYLSISDRFRKAGEAAMKGAAGQKRVPDDFILDFRLKLPPLRDQHQIADYLDVETAQIDNLLAEKEHLIALLEEKQAALTSRLVTRGLDPTVSLKRSSIPWLPKIPKHWEEKKLKYIVYLKSGNFITSESISERGDYPVFGGNGIRGYTSSFTHVGDHVLIGRQGALCGNIHFASGKFWASEHAVVARILGEEEVCWLGEVLRVMNLNQYSESAAQPGISVNFIGNLKIPVPLLIEQQEIVAHLSAENKKKTHIENILKKSINLLKARRSALITAAVTGQIQPEAMHI